MKFMFLEDIATADLAFDAYGKDLSELFTNAAAAVAEASANPKTVKAVLTKKIQLSEPTVEKLLFSFLGELIYLKDTEPMVFRSIQVKVREEREGLTVEAEVSGDHVKRGSEQELRMDIKAVTMHLFEIKKIKKVKKEKDGSKSGWKARVVVDI